MLLIIWTIKITKINNDNYDSKNVKQFLPEIVAKKISKNEAQELHKYMIEPKVNKYKNSKGRGKDKRNNILNILENIKLGIF